MRSAILLAAAVAGCAEAQAPAPAAPAFDAIGFFSGRSEGAGTLKVLLKSPVAVRVQSLGRAMPDGTLLLTQTIAEGAKAPRTREWRIRETAPGRYSGTLTDAVGSVSGEATGNRLRLGYRMKGGLDVEQWLTLAPGGRSASNRLVVRKFGITVASLDETIRKLD